MWKRAEDSHNPCRRESVKMWSFRRCRPDFVIQTKPALHGLCTPHRASPSARWSYALLAHGEWMNLSGVGGMKRPGIVHTDSTRTPHLWPVGPSPNPTRAHQRAGQSSSENTPVERSSSVGPTGVPRCQNDPRLRGVKGQPVFEPGNIH